MTAISFNPLSPDFIRNPYPFYEQLRTHAPMLSSPFGGVLASRHAEVTLVLKDKRFGKDFVGRMTRRVGCRHSERAGIPQHAALDADARPGADYAIARCLTAPKIELLRTGRS